MEKQKRAPENKKSQRLAYMCKTLLIAHNRKVEIII